MDKTFIQKYQKRLALYCHYGHYIVHFHMIAFPTLVLFMVQESYTNKSLEQVLYFGFWLYLMFGLGSIPIGIIADRWEKSCADKMNSGRSNKENTLPFIKYGILAFSYLLIGATCVLFLIPSSATNTTFLTICLALIGLGCSVYHPVGLSVLGQSFKKKGKILGENGIFGSLGVATAPVFTIFAMWISYQFIAFVKYVFQFEILIAKWQLSMVIIGMSSLVIGISMLADTVKIARTPLSKSENKELLAYQNETQNITEQSKTLVNKESHRRKSLRRLSLILLLAASGFIGISSRSFVITMPSMFATLLAGNNHVANSITISSILISLVYGCTLLGHFFGGKCADKYSLKKSYFIFHISALACLVTTSLALTFLPNNIHLFGWQNSFFPIIIISLLLGMYSFFFVGVQPIENTLIITLSNKHLLSFTYACKFVLLMGSGALAIQILGYLPNLILKWQEQFQSTFILNPLTMLNNHYAGLFTKLTASFQWILLLQIACNIVVCLLAFSIYLLLKENYHKDTAT